MDLAQKKCAACENGTSPLNRAEAQSLLTHLQGWTLSGDGAWISKEFPFGNFAEALAFGNSVGGIAEAEGHHPDLLIRWGKAVVELTTHSVGGLSENDFILAAKIDKIA